MDLDGKRELEPLFEEEGNATTSTSKTSSTASSTGAQDTQDRFLKLLVAQMQNQDPMNPMDNAQVTSQMAQINTVTGIDKLNTTMGAMNTSMAQMQMLQGASLVGHQVLLDGNQLALDSTGKVASGAYNLDAAAGTVRIDIMNAAGVTIDTVTLPSGPASSSSRDGLPAPFKLTAPSTLKPP